MAQKFVYDVTEDNNSSIMVYLYDEVFKKTEMPGKYLFDENSLKNHIEKYHGLCAFYADEEAKEEVQRLHKVYGIDIC